MGNSAGPQSPAERSQQKTLAEEVLRQQKTIDNLSSEKTGLLHEVKQLKKVNVVLPLWLVSLGSPCLIVTSPLEFGAVL